MGTIKEPIDQNGIGHTLWKIFTVDGVRSDLIAPELSLRKQDLSDIIHGRKNPAQDQVKEKNQKDEDWEAALARLCPIGWAAHSAEFRLRIQNCPETSKTYKTRARVATERIREFILSKEDDVPTLEGLTTDPLVKGHWQEILTGRTYLSLQILEPAIDELCHQYCLEPTDSDYVDLRGAKDTPSRKPKRPRATTTTTAAVSAPT